MRYFKFLYRINPPCIAAHFIATCFLVLASQQFLIFVDFELVSIVQKNGTRKALEILDKCQDLQDRIQNFSFWTSASPYIAILIAFVVSLMVTIKNKLFWLNSVIVLIIAYTCVRSGVFISAPLIKAVSFFSKILSPFPFLYKIIISGSVFICIGVYLFLSKKVIQIISKKEGNDPGIELDNPQIQ